MANIIAVIWDFDKTLIRGNMQDPIFRHYGVDARAFWDEVNAMPARIWASQRVRVNPDTVYLNRFLRETGTDGLFPGLNNAMLRAFGKEQEWYPGVPALFRRLATLHEEHPEWEEHGIRVENYIVSTGFAESMRGSALAPYTREIWGCELIESEDEPRVIREIGYTIDNTTKTRAIFEINKGIRELNRDGEPVNVNTKIDESLRRVRQENMIYIADGPSDVPAFSVVRAGGGHTMAVYPKGNFAALRQVNGLLTDERVDVIAEADYREDATATMWLLATIEDRARAMTDEIRRRIRAGFGSSPRHLRETESEDNDAGKR